MNSVLQPLVIGCLVANVISQNNAECSENPQCVRPGLKKKDKRDIVDCFSTTQGWPLRNHWTCAEDIVSKQLKTPISVSLQCPVGVSNRNLYRFLTTTMAVTVVFGNSGQIMD